MKNVFFLQLLLLVVMLMPLHTSAQLLEEFKKHTLYLSSDALGGRGNGSQGIEMAANYISEKFKEIGLEPIQEENYLQKFEYPGQDQLESNVIGIIQASETTERSIVFTAHYDGYGIRKQEGSNDSIYNGARDNAVGVAALIELARMYKNEIPPKVNLVFIATAAEEFGKHGSNYYLDNPIFDTEDIIMCLNIDGFNVSGKRINFFVMPRQGVDFVDDIIVLAQRLGWMYDPPGWVDSMNTNFDTASFLKRGVPAMTLWVGDRLLGGDMAPKLNLGDIHSPFDEINDNWDWTGVMDHLELYKGAGDYFINFEGMISVNNSDLFD